MISNNCFDDICKEGISCLEIQHRLAHSRCKSIFRMDHKIRKAMGKVDFNETLQGMIEFDEEYFEVSTSENIKRRRGSEKQSEVAVCAEFIPLENIISGRRSNRCGKFKMDILERHDGKSLAWTHITISNSKKKLLGVKHNK